LVIFIAEHQKCADVDAMRKIFVVLLALLSFSSLLLANAWDDAATATKQDWINRAEAWGICYTGGERRIDTGMHGTREVEILIAGLPSEAGDGKQWIEVPEQDPLLPRCK
jgi:hypothetical protein